MPFDSLYPTFFKVSAGVWTARNVRGGRGVGIGLECAAPPVKGCLAGGAEAFGRSTPMRTRSPEFIECSEACSPANACFTGEQASPTNPKRKKDNKNRLASRQVHFYPLFFAVFPRFPQYS